MQQSSTIRINPADTVIVCLRPMRQGEIIEVDHQQITLLEDVPMGHKVLIQDTQKDEDIIKYGYPIGHACQDLKAGQWVNEHNLATNLTGKLTYEYHPVDAKVMAQPDHRTFNGYVRKNGEVGIRNEIWIVPLWDV